MGSLSKSLTRGLKRLESLSGDQTFTWKSAAVPCVPNSLQRGVVIDIGGNPVEIALTLFCRLENFVTADSTLITVDSDLYTADSDLPVPLSGQTLVFRGVIYRILTAKVSGPQSHVEIHLADQHSGRL